MLYLAQKVDLNISIFEEKQSLPATNVLLTYFSVYILTAVNFLQHVWQFA